MSFVGRIKREVISKVSRVSAKYGLQWQKMGIDEWGRGLCALGNAAIPGTVGFEYGL